MNSLQTSCFIDLYLHQDPAHLEQESVPSREVQIVIH